MYPTIYDYLDNIHWTTIGTINEIKIFKTIYNKYAQSDNASGINVVFLFEESCYYCLKKYITTMWNDFSYVERDILWSKVELNGPTPDVYNLIYWTLYLSDKQLLGFIKKFSPRDYLPYKGLTDKRNMFNFSSTIGNDASVKHFFNRLTDEEKNNYLIHAAEQLLFNEKERQYNRSLVPIDKQINNLKYIGDTLIFFIKEMNENTRNIFFNKSCNFILGALAREWPWRFFYLTVLDYSWKYFNDFNYQILFNNIIHIIIEENKYNGTMKYSSLWLISETWKNSPLKLKKSIVKLFWHSNKSLIDRLEQISIIVAAIDDDGLKNIRQDICHSFKCCCFEFFLNNKYEIIDSFLNNILTSDYERTLFLNQITETSYKKILITNNYDNADKFLNWRFNNNFNDKAKFQNYWKISNNFIDTVCQISITHDEFDKNLELLFESLDFSKNQMNEFKFKLKNSQIVISKQLNYKIIEGIINVCDNFIMKKMSDEE